MSVIEKLIHDLDRPKAEVLVDVMVWEVSKSKITNLGLALQGNGSNLLTATPGSVAHYDHRYHGYHRDDGHDFDYQQRDDFVVPHRETFHQSFHAYLAGRGRPGFVD